MYQTIRVPEEEIVGIEQLGSKEKFWFRCNGHQWLFKETRLIQTPTQSFYSGEDWSEKLASEIAQLIQIPAAKVELATFNNKPGSASRNFTSPAQQLMHGNEVLAGYLENYDPEVRFKQTSHTVQNVIIAIKRMFPKEVEHRSVLTQLASYMILDALIGNTDRHHENWGLLWQVLVDIDEFSEAARLNKQYDVAPSFDHASSLGRELLDEKRLSILQNRSIEGYVRKAKGGIFAPGAKRGANPLALVESTAAEYPLYFQQTLSSLRDVQFDQIVELVNQLPEHRTTKIARDFAIGMLRVSYESLLRIHL